MVINRKKPGLNAKKVLITSGPTWVAIDPVRILSNIATGQTGELLAKKATGLGAKVTLFLGPVGKCAFTNKGFRLRNFKFFDDFKLSLFKTIKKEKPDIVIHSAAVSDYKPKKVFKSKLSSGVKKLSLQLEPTEKLINYIKQIDRNIFLVAFKFLPGAKKELLIQESRKLISQSRADMVVANSLSKNKYCAYLVKNKIILGPYSTKQAMVKILLKELERV